MEKEKTETKIEKEVEEKKTEKQVEEIKTEKAKSEKKEEKAKAKKVEAKVYGKDLPISTKQAVEICRAIRGKKVDKAIKFLEDVAAKKKAVAFRGEIPHRKGKGMMSGRYPVNAAKVFIKLLKSLNANASLNEIENPKIKEAIANQASRPYKVGGRERTKRSHVLLKAVAMYGKKENK